MELIEVIRKRRSIRKYKPDPVPDEYIRKIMEAARLAPSGTNLQPWRFVVVKSAEKRRELAQHTLEFVATAPVVVACCIDITAYKYTPQRIKELTDAGAFTGIDMGAFGGDEYMKKRQAMDENALRAYASLNCAISIEHLILRATDLGLGTCWVMMFKQNGVKEVLKLGESIQVVALVPVGYADQDPAPRPRLPMEDLLIQEV
ncbi:nitroreductase family protein [Desulfoscipio gibsoniae]|uniref:Nitroreductase n=1 Tax=Desulfoscipio gibsoniae DSM 7213 TaxID=767817 RepID=R4KMH6_9FIRM|nr:nitroreductase family protein [Desulfoscipio gibsoniae]AGL01740.1 nitroreductase [Desulfoscipio gibsoniae DSM 7213]